MDRKEVKNDKKEHDCISFYDWVITVNNLNDNRTGIVHIISIVLTIYNRNGFWIAFASNISHNSCSIWFYIVVGRVIQVHNCDWTHALIYKKYRLCRWDNNVSKCIFTIKAAMLSYSLQKTTKHVSSYRFRLTDSLIGDLNLSLAVRSSTLVMYIFIKS